LIKSMTGYGKGEFNSGDINITVEIRSVNSRFRDINIHIPKNTYPFEDLVKEKISEKIIRGRVDVNVQVRFGQEGSDYEILLNEELLKRYMDLFKSVSDRFGISPPVSSEILFQMRDVLTYKAKEMDREEIREGVNDALSSALSMLDDMRIQEGKAIRDDMLNRIRKIRENLKEIRKRLPEMLAEYKERFLRRAKEILEDIPISEERMMQELAIYIHKTDVNEELIRIDSHLRQFEDILTHDGALGRKIEFLIQEIHREVNTLSTKASDFDISMNVVNIKVELEKLREHAQNIE